MISLSLELQVRLCANRLTPKRFGISHWSFLIFFSCFHTRDTDTDPLRFLDEGAIYFSSLLSSYWVHVQWKRVKRHKELLPMLTMFWHVFARFYPALIWAQPACMHLRISSNCRNSEILWIPIRYDIMDRNYLHKHFCKDSEHLEFFTNI